MNFTSFLLFIILFSFIRAESQSTTQADSALNPKSVFDSPVDFSGWKENSQVTKVLTEFRIGLFLPPNDTATTDQSYINAANLAIDEINSSEEFNGIPYKLINRWSSDPWGAGSKEMIKLVYVDSVLAVVGSIDGNSTHVAEQISTKARLALLSPISADPTLNYIRIPWIFRLPPDYKAQAKVIVNEGIKSNQIKNIGLINENSHDGKVFVEELNDILSENQISPLFHFEVSNADLDFYPIVQRILSFNSHSIIICLSKDNIIKLLSELSKNPNNIDVVFPWIPGFDYEILDQYADRNIYYIEPFLRSSNLLYKEFSENYRRSYKSDPTFGAAYTYDAFHMLFQAIQRSGPNRAKLRDAIAAMNGYEGVTGKIIWDNGGGNTGRPVLKVLRKL